MPKSNLVPPFIEDSSTSRAINELYRQVNKLLTSISPNAESYDKEVLEGSVRAIYEGGDNYRIEGKTSNGWVGVTAQKKLRENSYSNMPRIISSGALKISNDIFSDGPINITTQKNSTINGSIVYLVGDSGINLDSAGDIELNADGGQITIKDDTASHFLFDCDATAFTIYDDTDVADYFFIQVGANGETTLQTVDAGAAVGHLNVKPDGNINLLSGSGDGLINISKQDDTYATFNVHHGVSDLKLFENGGASQNDYLSIQVGAHGATELITEDAAAAAASFKVTADGDINLDSHEVVILDGRDTAEAGFHIAFKANGTRFGHLTGADGAASDFQLYERGGSSTDDWFRVRVSEHGESNINTHDQAGTAAHLTFGADGNITLDSAAEIVLDQTDRLKLKKAGTEYIRFDVDTTSQFTMWEQGGASTDDYFKIVCATHGATTISTLDTATGLGEGTAADLTFDVDGDIIHEANQTVGSGSHIFKGAAYQWAAISGGSTDSSVVLFNPADTGDFFKILTGASGATTISSVDNQIGGYAAHLTLDPLGELNLTPHTEVKSDAPLKIKEAANAVADTAAYGQLWVKTATPNELYFTTDAGNDIQLTDGTSAAGGGGSSTAYWHQMVPGYRNNNTSTSTYYTFYRMWFELWGNSDSDPSTIVDTDSYSSFFIAPRAGTITNMKVQGWANDTGATDPFKFYFYKGTLNSNSDTVSLTSMMNSGAITPPAAGKTFSHTVDFSSDNTFAEDDSLFIWLKKDSNTGSQDLFFNINVNGEYS